MNTNTIRTFIAIELNKDIKEHLEKGVDYFKTRKISGVRWVSVQNIHLTLKFLGDTTSTQLEHIKQSLGPTLTGVDRFDVEFSRIGAFPNLRRPRVIWAGVNPSAELEMTQKLVEEAAKSAGIPPENRPFSAHLTLGRVSDHASDSELQAITIALKEVPPLEFGRLSVQEITLVRSDLRREGPFYTSLMQFKLQG